MTKSVLLLVVAAVSTAETVNQPPGGIGTHIAVEDGWLTVRGVLDETPASRAGVMPGDRIVQIDGKSTQNKTLPDALRRLAGLAGEDVRLTIRRAENGETKTFDVTLTRQVISRTMVTRRAGAVDAPLPRFVPTKRAGPVQFNGNKIVSRVLPYSDLVSLFVRLPVAHAAATGRGVKVAVIHRGGLGDVSALVRRAAPEALVSTHVVTANEDAAGRLSDKLDAVGCRIAVIPDVPRWPSAALERLVKRLLSANVTVLIPSDLSQDEQIIATVNKLHAIGALTVGRVNRQSLVMVQTAGDRTPFNRKIRDISTDVFSTVGLSSPLDQTAIPVATAAGVAALVLEKWPDLARRQVREKIVSGARAVWQAASIESGDWPRSIDIDPTTARYMPADERAIFRFRALDAAGAISVDTEIPWFLNMLNCHKAWEITKGRGMVVVVNDMGFHVRHPDLARRIKTLEHFGPRTFESPNQNFHGTAMSRILLAVAPEAELIPVLCSAPSFTKLPESIAKSFEFAAEHKADIVSSSWSARFAADKELLAAIRRAVDSGTVVSWFHYPEPYPGLLRPTLSYHAGRKIPGIGFTDRFLTDPPDFYPVDAEAGLSNTAPQAAGVAALAKSVNPGLTPSQIKKLIFDNSTPIGNGTVLIPDAYKIVVAAKDMASGGG